MKKLISILLIITLVISSATVLCSAYTPDPKADTDYSDIIQPMFSSIGSTTLNITTSFMSATCYGDIDSKYLTYLTITLELQKKASDGNYSTVKSWATNKTGTLLSFEGNATISPFSNYRLKGTFTADGEVHVMYDYPN